MLPITLREEWPVEYNPRVPDAEYAASRNIIPAIPVPREVIGIDSHFLGPRWRDDLHRLPILARVTAAEGPGCADTRAHGHRMSIFRPPDQLRLRYPPTVGALCTSHPA